MRCLLVFAFFLLFSISAQPASLDITLVTTSAENRENAGQSFAGITVKPQRPVHRAVELAVFESSALFETIGLQANIVELDLDLDSELREQFKNVSPSGLVILDLPLAAMESVAPVTDDMNLVAVNVRHSESRLRESLCLEHLFHAIPSDQMYFDALGQFLLHRGWRKILLVTGSSERDTERANSLIESLKRFGVTIVDQRIFSLSHHPMIGMRTNLNFLLAVSLTM